MGQPSRCAGVYIGMRHTTITGHHRARHPHTMAAAFWIVVGVAALIAFGDTLTLLAVVLAIATAAWCIYREVEHRVNRVKSNDARRYMTGIGSRVSH
jgi:Na+/H+ antiporter NhaB